MRATIKTQNKPRKKSAAKPIRLRSERFLLRTLRPSDVSPSFLAWFSDIEVTTPLNRRPMRMTSERLAKTIAERVGTDNFYIGVFEHTTGKHIGNYTVDRDPLERTAQFHVVIGDKAYWGKKVVSETRPILLEHFFVLGGVEKAIGLPPARNFPAVFNYQTEGWRLECVLRGHLRSRLGKGRLDQYQFGLLKEDWLSMRREH